MHAAVIRNQELVVAEVADPVPGPGHVLVRTLACGICGSDIHSFDQTETFLDIAGKAGLVPDTGHAGDLILGHEFCAEIVEFGPATEGALPIGTRVCAPPFVFGREGPETVGYCARFPGGFGELMLLQESMLRAVPDHVPTHLAALTEPLAVGEHAVRLARVEYGDVCMVIGCGPVGLAVIASLKARGLGPVLAVDFSATRRQVAEQLGADALIDPSTTSPYAQWDELGVPSGIFERLSFESVGMARNAVIFEAVGAPGVLQAVIEGAPARSRIVVVGFCLELDTIQPALAVAKELEMRFSLAYSPEEFGATLDRLSRSAVNLDALVTAAVDLDGIPGAFEDLRRADDHVKILIEP